MVFKNKFFNHITRKIVVIKFCNVHFPSISLPYNSTMSHDWILKNTSLCKKQFYWAFFSSRRVRRAASRVYGQSFAVNWRIPMQTSESTNTSSRWNRMSPCRTQLVIFSQHCELTASLLSLLHKNSVPPSGISQIPGTPFSIRPFLIFTPWNYVVYYRTEVWSEETQRVWGLLVRVEDQDLQTHEHTIRNQRILASNLSHILQSKLRTRFLPSQINRRILPHRFFLHSWPLSLVL